MTEWWGSLRAAEQVFYIMAASSSLILILQFILTLIGMGDHGDADLAGAGADVDVGVGDVDVGDGGIDVDHGGVHEHSTGLSLLSTRTILAFFVGFGWAGVIALHGGGGLGPATVIALIFGCLFMFVVFRVMSAIASLSEAGNIDIRNAVGQPATVYIPIPANQSGRGQVQVKVQGRLREVAAETDGDDPLPTGVGARVVKVIGDQTLLVRRQETMK